MDMNMNMQYSNKPNKSRVTITFILTFVGAILLLGTFFLPFASAKEDYKEQLDSNPDAMYIDEINMTNADAVNISLLEFARIYSSESAQETDRAVSITCVIMIMTFGAFSLLTLLLSIFRKPIGTMVLCLLAIVVYKLINFDFSDRGIIPSGRFDWSFSAYSGYAAAIIIIAGSIWMIIEKNKMKKSVYYVNM